MATNLFVAFDGVMYGLFLFLVAAGLTISLGGARLLNLAHGAMYLAGAYLGWFAIDQSWRGLALAVIVAASLGAGVGVALAALARWVPGELEQAVATAGLGLIGGWLLSRIADAQPQSVDPPGALAGSINFFGHSYPTYRIVVAGVAGLVALGLWLISTRTRAGMIARASVADPDLLATYGTDPGRARAWVLAVAGALAVCAGVWGAPITGAAPGLDHTMLVAALVVAIVGGSVLGALVTALVVGQVQTTALVAWPVLAPFLPYVLLVVVLLARTVVARRRLRLS